MSEHTENEELQVTELSGNAIVLEAQERASIDIQINTAKRFPRVLSMVKKRMLEFATLDQETAAACFYTLPARRGGDGKAIMGPSARLAEIAVTCYGHIRAAARIISNDGKMITAQGVCHDLENNVSVAVEVKRRITTKDGRTFSDDMQVVAGNAACSIALRNAVFKVVPMALVKPVYEASRKVAIGDAKTLASRRSDALSHFAKMGVSKEVVLTSLNLKSVEDITLEHLEHLIGLANAIKEGDTTIDEAFKPAAPEGATLSDMLKPKESKKADAPATNQGEKPAASEEFQMDDQMKADIAASKAKEGK